MKRLPYLLLLTLFNSCDPVFAFDTSYLRVRASSFLVKSTNTFLTANGYTNNGQNFIDNHVMQQSDTNYYLLSITPKNNAETAIINALTTARIVDLYQTYTLTENGPVLKIDNSTLYPVDTDWTVKLSSP